MLHVASPMSEVNTDALPTCAQSASVPDHVPQLTESHHAVIEGDSEQRLQRVQQTLGQWEGGSKYGARSPPQENKLQTSRLGLANKIQGGCNTNSSEFKAFPSWNLTSSVEMPCTHPGFNH